MHTLEQKRHYLIANQTKKSPQPRYVLLILPNKIVLVMVYLYVTANNCGRYMHVQESM